MAVRILMPKGSDTMTEGKVLKWLKREGEAVSHGDAVVEIETDKVDMEVEALGSGVLRNILVKVGETVPVGELLAVIGRADEDLSSMLKSPQAAAKAPAAPPAAGKAAGAAVTRPEGKDAAPAKSTASPVAPRAEPPKGPGEEIKAGARGAAGVAPPDNGSSRAQVSSENASAGFAAGRVLSSPLARRIAEEKGIDLATITGSGPGGRITKEDVERAGAIPSASRRPVAPPGPLAPGTASAPARPAVSPLPRPPAVLGPEYRDEPLSSMRKTIATRLAQSLGPVPHFYLTIEIDMKRAKELRESANTLDSELKLSYNDIILKAAASALRLHPEVNASFKGDAIRFHNRVHIGVAVAVEEGGLITPVVRDCDRKSLPVISKESRDLIARARHRKLQPEEYVGATFSISNLGMMGIEEFSAVINPPESAILAVGAVVEKPVVADGRIEVGTRCRMTLSCDHRVIDGATGAKFLQTLQRILENPVYLAF